MKILIFKKLLTNKLFYKINMLLYMLAMSIFSNKKNKKRYLLFKQAVHEGKLGELGNTFNVKAVK
jgi:hypothetical protein